MTIVPTAGAARGSKSLSKTGSLIPEGGRATQSLRMASSRAQQLSFPELRNGLVLVDSLTAPGRIARRVMSSLRTRAECVRTGFSATATNK